MSIQLIARLALTLVFFVAGLAKLLDLAGSRAAIAAFGLPKSLADPLGVALPVLELVVGIALIPAASARWGAFGAILLLGVFVAGIVTVMVSGREAECHCFGQLHSSRVGWPTLGRNLVLVFVAGFVIASERNGSTLGYMDWITGLSRTEMLAIFVGAFALAIFAAAGWFMMHLLRQHGRMLLRLDTLEEALAASGIIADPSAGSADGLAQGLPAPAFALPDMGGVSTTLEDLLALKLPLMLVFSHPGCTPCVAMLPELGRWQSDHGSHLTIALISQGTTGDNRTAAAEHGIEHVLLQREREVAEAYLAYATPSAVLVSREGIIASSVVQGAPAIRVLISSATAVGAASVNGNSSVNGNGKTGNDAQLEPRGGIAASMQGIGLNES